MSLKVYDYRSDIVNMLVTPQIRCRFLKMAVGQFNAGHTHDLGQEIFLILQGRAEFEIDGQSAVLGPGQMCIALTDQYHTVRNVGDDEVIMFLSVTPHIQPTHTLWNEDGTKQPAALHRRRRVRRAARPHHSHRGAGGTAVGRGRDRSAGCGGRRNRAAGTARPLPAGAGRR